MRIFVGADHNGFHLKEALEKFLKEHDYQVSDEGDTKLDPNDDYPIFATRLVNAMLGSDEKDPRGILLCGSGQGMAIAANRHKGIRAAVCWDAEQARMARNDDDANVLALPAWLLEKHLDEARAIVETFLEKSFAGAPRFVRRIKELDEL